MAKETGKHYGLGDPALWADFMAGVARQQQGVEQYERNVTAWLEAEKKWNESP